MTVHFILPAEGDEPAARKYIQQQIDDGHACFLVQALQHYLQTHTFKDEGRITVRRKGTVQ
jgi:hypothetical protein